MIHVDFGTDWYGAVKRVGRYRVVTEFFHINSFPLYPRYSAVIGRPDKSEPPQVVPLASRDLQSVTIAYVRAVAALLIVFGSIPLIFGIVFWMLNDGQPDIPPDVIMAAGGITIGFGAVLGGVSYLPCRQPNSRERIIRQIANSRGYVAADPAQIDRALSSEWSADLDLRLRDCEIFDYRDALPRAHQFPRSARELLLLRVRCELALKVEDQVHEGQTDLLLRDIAVTSNSEPV